jgi:hypothetical protein
MVLCAMLSAQAEPSPPATGDAPPSMEMLEFLANWETARGDWVDPTQFDDPLSAIHPSSEDEKHVPPEGTAHD